MDRVEQSAQARFGASAGFERRLDVSFRILDAPRAAAA